MRSPDHIPPVRFSGLTPLYDVLCSLIGLGAPLRRFEDKLLEGLEPQRILEVGCGSGELLLIAARRFPQAEITGLDVDRQVLALAERKLLRAGTPVRIVEGRAEALPFADGSFDLVLSSLMLHHLDSDTKVRALREWSRVLAPGGTLLLVDFGVPRSWLSRILLFPARFDILEEQADNFRGRVPGMLAEAGLEFREVGVYGTVVVAYRAQPRA